MGNSDKLKENIYITKPYLPPLDEYIELLKDIWSTRQLTNNGPYHDKFEIALAKFLGVDYLSLVNNATTALIMTLKALGVKGEVITTPFSFIATSHSIKYNGLKPIFVDTDNEAGNLDTEKVHNAINNNTGAILAVHNFGVPGDIDGLEKLSKNYNIPLIYDAAPCMGGVFRNRSISSYGDLSVLSFHATKVFTTFEGGAVISTTKSQKSSIDQIKNFSIEGPELISGIGINGKMNEAQAALGLLQLKYLMNVIESRKKVFLKYHEQLNKIDSLRLLKLSRDLKYNYAYFPVFFNHGFKTRQKVFNKLIEKNIFPRKYWYPLISDQKIYANEKSFSLSNSRKLASSVICLPIYKDLTDDIIDYIVKIIKECI